METMLCGVPILGVLLRNLRNKVELCQVSHIQSKDSSSDKLQCFTRHQGPALALGGLDQAERTDSGSAA